jgi:Leucine-rich repeat (LRR) protein
MLNKFYLSAALLLLSAFGASADVTINATNFPDPIFREWVSTKIDNTKGVISDATIASTLEISCEGKLISSLKGVEFFTTLRFLSCSGNNLTSLDLSANKNLKEVICSSNKLILLKLPDNGGNIKTLVCSDNKLTSLDISKIAYVSSLNCARNQLDSIDVSPASSMTSFDCSGNKLTKVTLGENAVRNFNCSGNSLTSVDISKCTDLSIFNCSNNNLTSFDVSANTVLETLNCSSNNLTSLGLSTNTNLTTLNCSNNKLTTLGVSANTGLTTLNCSNNNLTSLDLSKCTDLSNFTCTGNWLSVNLDPDDSMFDLSSLSGFDAAKSSNWNGASLSNNILSFSKITATYSYDCGNSLSATFALKTDSLLINEANFPDANFRAWVMVHVPNDAGVISHATLASFTEITCDSLGITNMKGIENFPVLINLFCSKNKLDSLDLTNNTHIKTIICSEDGMTSLKLPKGSSGAATLNCNNNKLTTLEIGGFLGLKDLSCSGNQLDSLDVSKNDIVHLSCVGNNMRELVLGNNDVLRRLTCYNNNLTSLDLSKCSDLTFLDCHANKLKMLDVSANTTLSELDCSNNNLPAVDVTYNTNLSSFTCNGNILPVVTKGIDNSYDLSELAPYRFVLFRASNWSGGEVGGLSLSFKKDTVTYSYDCGRDYSATFALKSLSVRSGVNAVDAEALNVFASDGSILISGTDSPVQAFDGVGRMVYSGLSRSIAVPSGMYIVKVAGRTFKTFVR